MKIIERKGKIMLGRAVRRAISCASMSAPMFEDDWAEAILEYHEKKSGKKGRKEG